MDFVDLLISMINKENSKASEYKKWSEECSDPHFKSVLCDIANQRVKHSAILLDALGTMARKVLKK